MSWTELSYLARGPLFNIALLIFIVGMVYRLVHVISLGWKTTYAPPKGSPSGGAFQSMLRGLIVFPFIPRLHESASRNPITYIAGAALHVGLFVVVMFGAAHILVWDSLLGFRWPSLPLPVIDFFAATTLIAMIVLFFNRLYNPVLKLLSNPSDFLNLLVVFLPFFTGFFLTHRLGARYEVMFTMHIMSINLLLVWIPFSRISHFMYYFITRPRYGARYAARGARP